MPDRLEFRLRMQQPAAARGFQLLQPSGVERLLDDVAAAVRLAGRPSMKSATVGSRR